MKDQKFEHIIEHTLKSTNLLKALVDIVLITININLVVNRELTTVFFSIFKS